MSQNPTSPTSLLRQEYDQAAALLRLQPPLTQRFVEAQARHLADAIVQRTPQLRFSLPDQVIGPGSDARPVAVNYLINQLQPLPVKTPVIVSLNPLQAPDPGLIHGEFRYSHPLFTRESSRAQLALRALNGNDGIWLAGAWMGYGFHEDGLVSALNVARRMNVALPWRELAVAA